MLDQINDRIRIRLWGRVKRGSGKRGTMCVFHSRIFTFQSPQEWLTVDRDCLKSLVICYHGMIIV